MSFSVPEQYRLRSGPFKSSATLNGNNGAFFIPTRAGQAPLKVIASDTGGWEHVSVSLPTWEQMCRVKALFWDDEDCVMQLHPPLSQWVNNHSFCLHLWRPQDGQAIPTPPQHMVGIPELGTLVRPLSPAQPQPAEHQNNWAAFYSPTETHHEHNHRL